MAETTRERKKLFNPNDPKHIVNRGGAKFITFVGLQAKLADQGKAIVRTQLELVQNGDDHDSGRWIYHVTMTIRHIETGLEAVLEDVGDASEASVGPMIKPHLPRMAVTRAKVRCLREATRSEYTAVEEIPTQETE